MINIAICDDDKVILSEIKNLLLNIAEKNFIKIDVNTYYDGSSLEKDINKGEVFDLLYLDIEMSQNGILTAKRLRERGYDVLIIYISSYEKYFRELFEVNTFRFLGKPIDKQKCQKYLLEAVELINRNKKYFSYQYNREIFRIKINSILYFESNKRKVMIHRVDGKVLEYYGKLDDVEKEVVALDISFMRTHQSFLVNCDYVSRCGTKLIELTDGQRIPVSEDQHKKIREQYSRFIRKDIFND